MVAKRGKKGKAKRPSMQDVADLAGVSKTTVSFVINEVPGSNIPPETQERVWKAIRKLGYRPNIMARSLRSKRSQTIGFVSDKIATTPYAGLMIQGAQDAAWAKEMILLLVNTGGDPEMEKAAIHMMLDRQVDGIIYATMYHRPVKPPDFMLEVPVVLLDCYCEDRSLPSVVPDEVQGGRDATQILLQKGHRRIGFINNTDPIPATFGRLKGYEQALTAYDVPCDENLICSDEANPEGGYRCALELMQRRDPPTAIFCFNDRMAMGAYDALRKLDLSIPKDVAIIGFDNQEIISAHLYPSLSTIALPHYEMGAWAANHLIEQTYGADSPMSTQHKIACPFVERASI
jgi:LacI family transcriptional regulator